LVLGINLWEAISAGNIYLIAQALLAGLPYAITLLGILGVHELGHYVAARLHGVQATLPYFIPLPFGLGTLGALIHIKSPMKDRRVLFDIGLAGPYAGLFVAFPLFLLGLFLSSSQIVPVTLDALTLERLGSSIFMNIALDFLADVPQGQTIIVHPILFAAWWGIFVTAINLLPVGQLDGGHTSYALFGRYAHPIALITFLLLIVAGALLQQLSWFIWAFFIMLGGLRHPPPMNDISDVGPVRKVVGIITIFVFVVIFVPVPRLIG
jgi:membrane-associated protease RseP (regulator of RpoE activity)